MPKFIHSLIFYVVSSVEDASLSLLQIQAAQKVRPFDRVNGNGQPSGGYCQPQGNGRVERSGGLRAPVTFNTPGLYTMAQTKDGEFVVQAFYCWVNSMSIASAVHMKAIAIKMRDNYIWAGVGDWEQSLSSNPTGDQARAWTKGTNVGFVFGINGTKTSSVDLDFELTTDAWGGKLWKVKSASLDENIEIATQMDPKTWKPYHGGNTKFYIHDKITGNALEISGEYAYKNNFMTTHIWLMNDDRWQEDTYDLCNMHNKYNDIWDLDETGHNDHQKRYHLYVRALKNVKTRGCGQKGGKDKPETPCYEGNLVDLVYPQSSAEFCKYCAWSADELKKVDHSESNPVFRLPQAESMDAWTWGSRTKCPKQIIGDKPADDTCKAVLRETRDAKAVLRDNMASYREMKALIKEHKSIVEENHVSAELCKAK